MGQCCSDEGARRGRRKGSIRRPDRMSSIGSPLTPRKQPQWFTCPNTWCMKSIPASQYQEHRMHCDQKRMSNCPKCGEVVPHSQFQQHIENCNPVRCPTCGEMVIKILLPMCPNTHKRRVRQPPPKTDHEASLCIQRFVRGMKVTKLWTSIIFQQIWFAIDKWDERGIFKAATMSNEETPVRRLSHLIRNSSAVDEEVVAGLLPFPVHGFDKMKAGDKEEHIFALRELVLHQKTPSNYFRRLLSAAKEKLSGIANVQYITLPSDRCHCVVVGDLHGQLQDLIRILDDRGLPSEKHFYVFNGDFVDRGCNSCEVLSLVLALFLAYPQYVFINRGNHESLTCTDHYGCHTEVLSKYSEVVYREMLEVFEAMPICSVVNNEVFVVHGGLTRYDITVEELNSLYRFREIPVQPVDRGEQILMDLMWSDPDPEPYDPHSGNPDWEHNTIRDAGCKWRLPLTKRFCERNGLKLIIRSHHPPHTGYERLHEDLVHTVFSASNYTGIDSNHGAIAVLATKRTDGQISVFYDTWKIYEPLDPGVDSLSSLAGEATGAASPMSNSGSRHSSFSSLSVVPKALHRTLALWSTAESEVLRQLRERIFHNRHLLLGSFCEVDTTDRGTVWLSEWVEEMAVALGVDLPWYFLRRYLADTEEGSTRIPFARFIRRHSIPLLADVFDAWLPHIVRWIEVQFSGTPMSEIFDSSDHNHSSTLYYSEFFDLVTNTLGTLLNKDVVFMLYNAFDPDETGYTQRGKWNDMFSRHKDAGYISDVQNWALGGWESDNKQQLMWDVWLIQRFRKFMRRLPPATAFKMLDQDKKGCITLKDLRYAIQKMNLTGEGHTDAQHKTLNAKSRDFRKRVIYKLGRNETQEYVAKLFGVTKETVSHGMRKNNKCEIQTWPLSEHQLQAFHDKLDIDGDGRIGLNDFQLAFAVQDLSPKINDRFSVRTRSVSSVTVKPTDDQ
ncbi:Serine/threonine-protein phosphatase [Diplonema papillatum]|nr:Serine/threonine-protein phosphatase [Diplonema papillatum]